MLKYDLHFAVQNILIFRFAVLISTRLFLVFMFLYRCRSSTREEKETLKSLAHRAEGKAFTDTY